MTDHSPVEGVVRQVRKAIDDHRADDRGRILHQLSDVAAVIETAEHLNLRTPVLDIAVHDKLVSVLGSIGSPPVRGWRHFIPRKNPSARGRLPIADTDGQLALPIGDD